MRRPLPVLVEPLSPQRWAKIERGLFGRLEAEDALGRPLIPVSSSSRAWRVWVAVSVAALALMGGFVAVAAWRDVPAESHTSRIATGADGSHLAIDGLTLDVEPQSTVVVGQTPGRGLLVVVDRGSVVCDVRPRPATAPLVVQAGAAQIRVIGTRFKVERRGDAARVQVEHGVVEVTMGGRRSLVTTGQSWPPPPPPAAAGTAPNEERVAEAELAAPLPTARELLPGRRSPSGREAMVEGSPQARFERATALERTSPGAALSLYRSLEGGADSWAANALFAHARLELARGNQTEGRRLLERYLTRFPRAPNSGDARALLKRLK